MPRNILIVNDDGKHALGYKLLGEVVDRAFKEAHKVYLSTDRPHMGKSLAITHSALEDINITPGEPDHYEAECMPVELIYLAMMKTEWFLPTGTFDLILCGINHGANVGFDVMHSGTVGQAILASYSFGVAAVAFSQDSPELFPTGETEEHEQFTHAPGIVADFLREHSLGPGDCYNVNIPMGIPKGWKSCEIAPYSKFRDPGLVGRRAGHDVYELENGYVTISEIQLSLSTPRFV